MYGSTNGRQTQTTLDLSPAATTMYEASTATQWAMLLQEMRFDMAKPDEPRISEATNGAV